MNQTETNSPQPVSNSPSPWIRVFSRLPLAITYPFASFAAWLAWRPFPYRRHVVEGNLKASFPDWDDKTRDAVIRDYYRGFADVFIEVLRSLRLSREELAKRVILKNPEVVREETARGKPVFLLGAHQCNWEWMLLALSSQLDMPLDAAYKPLRDSWAEAELRKLRSRLGARMISAQDLLGDILKQRGAPRAIAILADQEPKKGERLQWLSFLNRDTAFYVGPEQIARSTRYPAFFLAIKRVSRGHYEVEFVRIATAGEQMPAGEFTARYARLVEEQIRAAPADWPWSHKRWKMKKEMGTLPIS